MLLGAPRCIQFFLQLVHLLFQLLNGDVLLLKLCFQFCHPRLQDFNLRFQSRNTP